ncbi:hypothetical protein [Marinagarivorans algicola]|uniref:hypothetical protein n=1 Tax=Marinagarivorans algicola TaxID=1513270 RepID=UPI0006B8DC0B|nr:hypothetical protein [Marinagarivorans algicola]
MRYPPLLLSAALLAPASYADIQFNGFLSAVGGVATDEPIRGYEKDATFKNDTLFGLQASADISDKLSLTGQLVSRGADDYATDLSWGYLAYNVSSKFRVRMGRFRTPFYSSSDFLEVGYAYPWITPADEVYALEFDNIEGVDLFYNTTLFDTVNVDLQAYYGSVSTDTPINESASGDVIDTETRNHFGISVVLGVSDFSLRLSGHNAKLFVKDFQNAVNVPNIEAPDPRVAPLVTVAQFIASAKKLNKENSLGADEFIVDIENRINDIEETSATFLAASLRYDGEYGFAVAEGTNLTYDKGPSAEQTRFMLGAGVNIGSATIFTSYSEADDEYVDLTEQLVPFGDKFERSIAVLGAISESLGTTSNTISFGVRYDFEPGAAIKIQYDAVSTPDPLKPDEDITNGLLRFGVDLVF